MLYTKRRVTVVAPTLAHETKNTPKREFIAEPSFEGLIGPVTGWPMASSVWLLGKLKDHQTI